MSFTRNDLIKQGFLSVGISSDLFSYGIRIRHWFRIRDFKEAIEYTPRTGDGWRVIVTCYEEQVEFHRSKGINTVPPGECWYDGNKFPLFADADNLESRIPMQSIRHPSNPDPS